MSHDDPHILRGSASFAAFTPEVPPANASALTLVERERTPGSLHQPAAPAPRWRRLLLIMAGLGGLGLLLGLASNPDLRRWLLQDAPPLPSTAQVMRLEESVLIEVAVRPAHARLFLDGEPVASNPLRVVNDGRLHRLMAIADGHKPGELVFSPDTDQKFRMQLRKRGPGR